MKLNNLILMSLLLFVFTSTGQVFAASAGVTPNEGYADQTQFDFYVNLTGDAPSSFDIRISMDGGHAFKLNGGPQNWYYNNQTFSSAKTYNYEFLWYRDGVFYDSTDITGSFTVKPIPSKPSLSGGVYIQDITGGFRLTWNNASGTVSNYELYKSTSSGSLGSRIYSGSSTSYNDTELSNNITYYYTAKACNESGCDTSNQDYKKYVAPVSKPSLSGGVYIQDITEGFRLTWNNASGTVSNYELYKSTSSGSLGSRIYSGSSTSYNDTGLSNNTTYYYAAKACNESGCDTSNQDYKKYVAPVSNHPPSISINTINVESDGDVTVTYVISDPENGYMGTDIYLTTTSGGGITGISKKGLTNRTQGTYSVNFPVAELYNLSSNSSYKIIADVFDDKGVKTRTEQIFTYTYASNHPPSISINTINVESDGDVTVTYVISDPENGYMGTDIYLTTTSGGGITGISKKGLTNRTQGTYSVNFPVAELYNLSS